jgi:hypothetical protein
MLKRIHCFLFGHNDLWYLSLGERRVKCFYCDRISPGFKHLRNEGGLRCWVSHHLVDYYLSFPGKTKWVEEVPCDTSLLHLR